MSIENNHPLTQPAADTNESVDTQDTKPMFTAIEARVLACLMEKELTVPETYPLTLNSLTLACNQKSNREPLMKLPEGEVGHIANELVKRELVKINYGDRANRYEHKARQVLQLDKPQQALLTVMMLRAPQTLNDLKVRTQRMVDFDSAESIVEKLNTMIERDQPLVQLLPKGPGQREDRYTHLLCGEVEVSAIRSAKVPAYEPSNTDKRLDELEAQVAELLQRVADLEMR